ncbi:cation channel family protein [Stylonychia lemnae]|uniref:Cation channel family protein n=1 Tax=Stylonychia lemnae TaxID=5949 RepID=A0A078APJ5_STYLE|nr:cation channel family protein [Stylonychia lemnae]|eukprot:CDW82858.1 cation channel family protein [Stylonychia lemnae]
MQKSQNSQPFQEYDPSYDYNEVSSGLKSSNHEIFAYNLPSKKTKLFKSISKLQQSQEFQNQENQILNRQQVAQEPASFEYDQEESNNFLLNQSYLIPNEDNYDLTKQSFYERQITTQKTVQQLITGQSISQYPNNKQTKKKTSSKKVNFMQIKGSIDNKEIMPYKMEANDRTHDFPESYNEDCLSEENIDFQEQVQSNRMLKDQSYQEAQDLPNIQINTDKNKKEQIRPLNTRRQRKLNQKLSDSIDKMTKKTSWPYKCFEKLCLANKSQNQKRDLMERRKSERLLRAMKVINNIFIEKQKRQDYLWRKVRAFVLSGIFVRTLQEQTMWSQRKILTGISDRKQKLWETGQEFEESALLNRYKCWIKYDSSYRVFWEFIMACIFCISFWLTPLNLATHFLSYNSLRSFEIFIDMVILFDIVFNFVTEARKDVIILTTLKDTAKLYLKTYFFIDIASSLPSLLVWEQNIYIYPVKIIRFIRVKRLFKFFEFLEAFVLNFKINQRHKQYVHKVIKMIQLIFLYFLLFHLCACVWFYMGYDDENIGHQDEQFIYQKGPDSDGDTYFIDGWIGYYILYLDLNQYAQVYIRSFYCVVQSFTTIGFGDISAYRRNEYIFAMVIISLGQLLFSYILERMRRVLLSKNEIDTYKIQNELQENAEIMLIKFSKIKGAKPIKNKDIKLCSQYIKESFKNNHKNILKDKYFRILSPRLQKKLIIELFDKQYKKFIYFFEDFELKYKASDDFISGCLSNMELNIFFSNQTILKQGQKFECIYFINHGHVGVFDKFNNFLINYVPGGYFGDFQIILELKSQFTY